MEEVHGRHKAIGKEASVVRHAFLALLTLASLLKTVQTDGFPLYYCVSLSFSGVSRLGRSIVAATKVAEDDIKEHKLIPDDYPLTRLEVNDRCSGNFAMRGIFHFTGSHSPTDAIVAFGGICSSSCKPVANYFGANQIIFISSGCRTDDLLDNNRDLGYPWASRLVGSWKRLITPFMKLMDTLKFKKFGMLSTESDPDWLQLQKQLNNAAIVNNLKHVTSRMEKTPAKDYVMDPLLEAAKKALSAMKGKAMVIALLLNNRDVMAALLAAKELDMLDGYMYIAIAYTPDENGDMYPDDRALAKEVQEGLVSINTMIENVTMWNKFVERVQNAIPTVNASLSLNKDETIRADNMPKQLSVYAALLYDSMMLWAEAVNNTNAIAGIENKKPYFNLTTAQKIQNRTRTSHYKGLTGPIYMNANGDRKGSLSVDVIQNGFYVPILSYKVEKPNDEQEYKQLPAFDNIIWPVNRKTAPLGYPKPCGFDRELCPPGIADTLGFQVGVAVGAFLLVVIIILLIWFFGFYRRAQRQAEINAINAWIVNFDEVLTNFEGKSLAEKKRVSSAVRRISYGSMGNKEQTFSTIGFYKGTVVCIKHIDRGSVDRFDHALFSELKEMRSIKHENVNGFIGVCIDAPNVCYLTFYCKNGSIQDIVQDEDFDLGTEFKISFAMDIAQGMEYLHESVIVSHGRLNSSNCVIDNKWTCKITDYGMGNFRRKAQPPEINEKYFSNKLWTAPELLRLPDNEVPLYGTQKGDVYSYGIIMQELALRDAPFSKLPVSMTYEDVIEMVKMSSEPPFRPRIPAGSCSFEWEFLMTNAWAEQPDDRPTFREIMKTANLLSGGQAINIVDNMMKKLEKHNEKLEELVAERTAELNVEKKRVEVILYNILPKSVAESLMRQGRVVPQSFDLATIYFSDIVGFMKINQSSTAYQVVALLNAIYSVFDDVTDIYDVYKCETIGDVYMVASGLPVPNDDRHASEIATMALHLLSSVASFKIPHMPGKLLQLRIGLHTGPVVTGVVGQKMPHYCLFGDTVNTASRMQSGGLALRIHASNSCAELLMKSEEFQLEYRGEREVKGKGLMKTYWVLSKTGFDMPLPDLSLAASLEEHEFK